MLQRRGYTLFELVLVLALLVVLAAIAYPSLDAMVGDYRIAAAVDQARAGWAQARSRSIDEGRAYRFAVIPNTGNYRIAPNSPEFWNAVGVPVTADGAVAPLVLEDGLPRGVRFVDSAQGVGADASSETLMPVGGIDPSMWSPVVTFLPDGTAQEDVRITFQTKGARPMVLRMRGLTGAVNVYQLAAEGYP